MAVKSLRESRWRVFVLLGALAVGLAAVSESPRARVWATEVNVETKPVSQDGSETSPSRVEAKQEVSVWPMPLPSLEARQKARKLLEEVYKDQIAKARLPHEKGKLAKEMLDLALDDLDPANQYVLAEEARRLALEAMDRKLVMRAVELLAQFEPIGGKVSAQEAAKRGHTAWAAAERLTGKAQLGRQAEAAEWYLRALRGNLAEMEEKLIRKRLTELGVSEKNYLPPQVVLKIFPIPNPTVKGEEIHWMDPRSNGIWSNIYLLPPLEFGFDIRAPHRHSIRFVTAQAAYTLCIGHQQGKGTIFAVGKGGKGHFQEISDRGILFPEQWHNLRVKIRDSIAAVYYDNQLIFSGPIEMGSNDRIRVGLGDHQAPVAIRHVFLQASATESVEVSPPPLEQRKP